MGVLADVLDRLHGHKIRLGASQDVAHLPARLTDGRGCAKTHGHTREIYGQQKWLFGKARRKKIELPSICHNQISWPLLPAPSEWRREKAKDFSNFEGGLLGLSKSNSDYQTRSKLLFISDKHILQRGKRLEPNCTAESPISHCRSIEHKARQYPSKSRTQGKLLLTLSYQSKRKQHFAAATESLVEPTFKMGDVKMSQHWKTFKDMKNV